MPKVSIIIPVYNTEKYLPQCLNSAVCQTLQDIEIIVINDASTDKSLEIIQEFKKKDNRIQLINFTKNKGNGIGRNTALKQAKGDYILFLDSDDWLEKEAAEICYHKAEKINYELLLLSHKEIQDYNENSKPKTYTPPNIQLYDPNFFRYFLLKSLGFGTTPWNYFYKKQFLLENQIFFSEGVFWEDLCFIAKTVYYVKRVGVINDFPVYNYRLLREGAITSKLSKKKIIDLYEVHIFLKNFLIKNEIFQKYEKEYMLRFLTTCVEYSFRGYFVMKKHEKDEELKIFMNDIRKSDLMSVRSILILKDIIKKYAVSPKDSKNLKRSYRFLLATRQFYRIHSFIYKLKYKVYIFFLNQKKTLCPNQAPT